MAVITMTSVPNVAMHDKKSSTTTVVVQEVGSDHDDDASPHPDTDYKLNRDGRESLRLTAQHYCLVARQGFLLHPTLAESIRNISQPRIADVATGNGVWAAEVAREYPHASVLGLDVSDAQYSPKWTWGRNSGFDLYDLLQDVPAHLQGQFDVVHVRLILAAGPNVDKNIFIDRFRKLLRPDGWLQWDDLCYPNVHLVQMPTDGVVKTSSARDYPIMHLLNKYLSQEERISWIDHFQPTIQQAGGFDSIIHSVAPVRPELLTMETELTIAVFSDLANILILNSRITSPQEVSDLRRAVVRMCNDRNEGLLFTYNWHTGIARRSFA
ncbi:NAD(+) salvage pathway protein [Lithohypha guttulata]|uniref:Methyltransferase type 12 domain-containing protein n=1 Tax=Lithohypha guttulata TaxID=1690604 RepID=A0AAN7Y4T5_9EURO|nr:hypothetical protein LTR51_002820 [Lithohypha guttulata]KAK5083002.1 hypothetical protein LTR05_006884 [Lithohypha guttulata]